MFLPKGAGEGGRFHPKLYLFDGERESSVIVGSANLTGAGLETNHEASLWLRGEPDDDVVGAIRDGFELLWGDPYAVALNDQIRIDYQNAKRARDRALAQVVQLEEYRTWSAARERGPSAGPAGEPAVADGHQPVELRDLSAARPLGRRGVGQDRAGPARRRDRVLHHRSARPRRAGGGRRTCLTITGLDATSY